MGKIELGSEFNLCLNDLSVVEDNLFSYFANHKIQLYNYGRSAIRAISVDCSRIVLMPEFICESVINCFQKDRLRFYKVKDDFSIDLDDLISKIDASVGYIYIAHYFGFAQDQGTLAQIRQIADKLSLIVIEDVTQSLFSVSSFCGDYGVASIRKWMPVPMGGILYANVQGGGTSSLACPVIDNDNSRAYGMILKDMFLKSEYDTNAKYREIFSFAEENVDKSDEIHGISDFGRFLISCVSINELRKKRKRNVKRLYAGLSALKIDCFRQFKEDECPLVLPLRVKNRDEFRKYLTDNRIYCAVHWPFDGYRANERVNAVRNAETLISLPIDQRYGGKEIDYMLNVFESYRGELRL